MITGMTTRYARALPFLCVGLSVACKKPPMLDPQPAALIEVEVMGERGERTQAGPSSVRVRRSGDSASGRYVETETWHFPIRSVWKSSQTSMTIQPTVRLSQRSRARLGSVDATWRVTATLKASCQRSAAQPELISEAQFRCLVTTDRSVIVQDDIPGLEDCQDCERRMQCVLDSPWRDASALPSCSLAPADSDLAVTFSLEAELHAQGRVNTWIGMDLEVMAMQMQIAYPAP